MGLAHDVCEGVARVAVVVGLVPRTHAAHSHASRAHFADDGAGDLGEHVVRRIQVKEGYLQKTLRNVGYLYTKTWLVGTLSWATVPFLVDLVSHLVLT